MYRAGLIASIVLAACSAPAPPSDSMEPKLPSVDPQPVATQVGLASDQLIAIEEGFVAARFNDRDALQLVWIRPAGENYELATLASADETRAEGSSRISTSAVVCPAGVGLTRLRFVFGQATGARVLEMGGPEAVGGRIVDDTYVFALSPSDGTAAAGWTLTDETGRRVATSDPRWFTEPAPPPQGNDLCSIASEH